MFSGIGGFELGIQRTMDSMGQLQQEVPTKDGNADGTTPQRVEISACECVGYSEIDKYAIETYQKNFEGHKNYGDANTIRTDTIPDFDLLVGGFPCQAFSMAGHRRGFEDTRGTLFFEIARVIKDKQPRLFVLENVKGLLNHNRGETFTTILKTIDELGYDAEWEVLNSKHHGVPQNRERVFIIGYLRGTSRPEVFPLGSSSSTPIQIAIKDKFQKTVYDPEGISPTIREGHGDVVRIIQLNQPEHSTDRLYSTEGLARTLRSNAGGCGAKTGAYQTDTGIRKLTPTECERLQGFPDGWTEGVSDTQRYKQLGNAVTVNVIEAVMSRLL